MGGGTGGHIFPLAAVVRFFRHRSSAPDFLWVGERASLEEKVSRDLGVPFFPITSGKVRRYFSWRTFATPFWIVMGIFQAIHILRRQRPTLVFSKGGYVAVPVALAAWILKIPVVLHESDAIPGWANRVVGRFAKRVFLNFPEAATYFDAQKTRSPGALLNPDLFEGSAAPQDQKIKPVLLVLCGSQGSARIFDALLASQGLLQSFETHIILGTANAQKYGPLFRSIPGINAYDFLPPREIGRLAARADCAITRASSALFELEAFGVKMGMIPLTESANGHQLANARAFEKKGQTVLLESQLPQGLSVLLSSWLFIKKSPTVFSLPEGPYREIESLLDSKDNPLPGEEKR